MGIKGLWSILTPYSEKKSLHEIRGETVAVDLSGWVCDSQNVTDYHIQPRLYLRNLFFRTLYLLLADIKPVFVLEGDAPELKRDVMAARNAIQFRGAAPRAQADPATKKRPDIGRKRFKNVLKECATLLKSMGVACVKGLGEAEATCAQLNADGLVDAVISQDSDCFGYGAVRVYRNFSVSNSAGGGALQGSVDCYDAKAVFAQNGFGRNKMVGLAMLCGCDYGVGAVGSSIATAVSFLHTVPDGDIVPRLLSWVSEPEVYEEKARWLAVPGRCDRCGHAGRSHTKNGCPVCVTHRSCNDTGHKLKVAEVKRELSLRSRALSSGSPFPEPLIMKEFQQTVRETITLEELKTPTPSLVQFVALMKAKLDWSERYCVEKFLPLLTRWHLQEKVLKRTVSPLRINKKRTPRGVPSFEVVWSDVAGHYEGLVPDDQIEEGENVETVWTTTERQDLMRMYYPDVVNVYEESIKKPPKEKKIRGRKKKDPDVQAKPKRKYTKKLQSAINAEIENINVSMNNLNITKEAVANQNDISKSNISVSVNELKRKFKTSQQKFKKQKTLESFLSKKRKSTRKHMQTLRNSFKNMSLNTSNCKFPADDITEKENFDLNHEKQSNSIFEMSEDDVEDCNLSDIIDKIVARKPHSRTATVNNNLVRLIFAKSSTPYKTVFRKSLLNQIPNSSSTPTSSPSRCRNSSGFSRRKLRITDKDNPKVNVSYFFDKLTDEQDAFELSIDYRCEEEHLITDKTVEYSFIVSV